jgi:putative NADH-flavin reductase
MTLRLFVLGATGHIGAQVVDIALARGHSVTAFVRSPGKMAECAASTVAAMRTAGIDRVAIVSAAVLFPQRGLGFAFFRWLLRHHARDLVAMETVVQATSLDWTIARPPRLIASERETYRHEPDALPADAWSMSYRAVAAFLVDCIEKHEHPHQIVGLAS